MDRETIINALEKATHDILGNQVVFDPDKSLKELGANSLDRADILMQTMETLGVKISMVSFGTAKNISDVISVFQAS